jgi:hypothetical protein
MVAEELTKRLRDAGFGGHSPQWLHRLGQAYAPVAREKKCKLIDLHPLLKPGDTVDGAHPNEKGHAKIADAVWQSLVVGDRMRTGDWIVTGRERVVGKHLQLDGNLVLEDSGRLELEDCRVEIIGSKSREHLVGWRGGTLVTKNCTSGGFLRDDGTPIHTVFHLYDGVWEATDTIVQYSYGISFGHNTGGRLAAIRLKAGPRPDAIIASGTADITLTECEFPIAVALYAHEGGNVRFDLPVKTPVDRVFDASNTPGIKYRMELKRTIVPDHWFAFVRNIADAQQRPRCEVTFGDCPKLIVSLLGHNVTGQLHLSHGR